MISLLLKLFWDKIIKLKNLDLIRIWCKSSSIPFADWIMIVSLKKYLTKIAKKNKPGQMSWFAWLEVGDIYLRFPYLFPVIEFFVSSSLIRAALSAFITSGVAWWMCAARISLCAVKDWKETISCIAVINKTNFS